LYVPITGGAWVAVRESPCAEGPQPPMPGARCAPPQALGVWRLSGVGAFEAAGAFRGCGSTGREAPDPGAPSAPDNGGSSEPPLSGGRGASAACSI
jgi:hypothetical protein